MKQILFTLFVLSALTACGHAAVIYQDAFDADNGNWNPFFHSAYTIAGGKLTVQSDSATDLDWIGYPPVDAKNFTLTVETEATGYNSNARLGVAFRTQNNFDCYQFLIYPSGDFIINKYKGGAWADFSGHKTIGNSFIRGTQNTLTVVVRDTLMSFMCNGQLLCKVVDTGITGLGTFGLIANGVITASFDNLMITDATDDIHYRNLFADDFSNSALLGWRNYSGNGTFSVLSNKCQAVAASGSSFSILISDGNYGSRDTVTAVVEKTAGNTSYVLGLLCHYSLVPIDATTVRTQGYIFCILNGTNFTLLKLTAAGVSMLINPPLPSTSIRATGGNTLKVVNGDNAQLKLYINNALVNTVTDTGTLYSAGGVGLVANEGVTATFDDFRVAAEGAVGVETAMDPPVAGVTAGVDAEPNPCNPSTRITLNGLEKGGAASLRIFNMQGRMIANLSGKLRGNSTVWDGAGHPSGLYLARASFNGKTAIRQILLVK
ncbi:MAG: T9SS type A sorting domain-containing protein [Fibrobacterota bacterium]